MPSDSGVTSSSSISWPLDLALASQDGGLHGGAVGHGLVGVDALVRLLAVEEVLDQLLHLGDASGSADQHDLVDLPLVHLRRRCSTFSQAPGCF